MSIARPRAFFRFSFFLVLFLFLFSISSVYAEEDIDIMNCDTAVGESLGLSGSDAQVVGGLILTTVLVALFLFPTAMLTKGKSEMALAVAVILPLAIATGFSWLATWVMLLLTLLIAGLFAKRIVGALT